MRGLPLLLWQVYNLQDCQEDHPIRRAATALVEAERKVAKLEDEATRMLALARENGQLRDVARRERDAALALLREARASVAYALYHGSRAATNNLQERIDILLGEMKGE